MKIWLDTDIGSDIDDALALAFLLAHPDCELVGVSTVTEHNNERAKLVSALCRAAGQTIPIFPGARDPLLIENRQSEVQQRAALEKWPPDEQFSDQPAPLALRDAILEHGQELTLLTIGPLTNVATAFLLDPSLPARIGEFVAMTGAFERLGSNDGREWNSLLDPHAAHVVYAALAKNRTPNRFFGLDVTMKTRLERPEVETMLSGSELGRCVLDIARAWFQERSHVVFHDPLAAAALVEPDLCDYRNGTVEVELDSPRLRGFTLWNKSAQGPHQIAREVDVARFFAVFGQTIGAS